MEGARVLSWGSVVPEVGPDRGGGVGLGDPVGGVHPLRHGAEVEGGQVEGGGGGGGGVAGGVEVKVLLGQVAELQGHDLVDVGSSEGVGGGSTVLVVSSTSDKRDIVGGAGEQLLNVLLGQDVAVQHRLEDQRVASPGSRDPPLVISADTVLGADEEVLDGHALGTELSNGGGVVVGGVVDTVLKSAGHVDVRSSQSTDPGVGRVVNTRLRDTTGEETLEQNTVHGVVDLRRAEGLAHDGNTVWVTTKVGNVGLHPLQGGLVVEHTPVARGVVSIESELLSVQVRVSQVTESIVTTVEGHDDDVVLQSHTTTVPPRVVGRLVGTLVPHNDGKLVSGGVGRGPYVKVQAVLAVAGGAGAGARSTPCVGDQGLIPRRTGLRLPPPVLIGS